MSSSLTPQEGITIFGELIDKPSVRPEELGQLARRANRLLRHCRPEVDERVELSAEFLLMLATGQVVANPVTMVRVEAWSLRALAQEATGFTYKLEHSYAVKTLRLLEHVIACQLFADLGKRTSAENYEGARQETEGYILRLQPLVEAEQRRNGLLEVAA